MRFYLFILVNATLFLRPAEIIYGLEGVAFYEATILTCLFFSLSAVWRHLTTRCLTNRLITVCVLGLLVAVVFSHLSNGYLYGAAHGGIMFLKIVVYYLLLVSNVTTPERLRHFLGWMAGLIVTLTILTICRYHDLIDLPFSAYVQQSEEDSLTQEATTFPRLCGMGIFNDPNDLSIILACGILISFSRLVEVRASSPLWLGALLVLGYALILTHSRGGFLAMLAGGLVLIVARFGGRKAAILGGLMLPAIFLLLGGRQTNIQLDNQNDTAQFRIRLWSDGLVLFKKSPVFGIGEGKYADEVGLVAHNSFVHAFTELGVFGGTLFLGAFLYPLGSLYRLGSCKGRGLSTSLYRLRPLLMSLIAATAGGMLSLSRVYTITPYIILGMVSVYLSLAASRVPSMVPRVSWRTAVGFVTLSTLFLLATHLFVRLFYVKEGMK